MPQKQQISVTEDRAKNRCPPMLRRLIDLVNSIPPETALPHQVDLFNGSFDESPDQRQLRDVMREILRDVPDWYFQCFDDEIATYISFRNLRRTVHEMAQIAALPDDWRQAYALAVVSDTGVWERFQTALPAPLWREWTMMDAGTVAKPWRWPWSAITHAIGDDGRISSPELDMLTAWIGVEAKRLKECRHCQRIFWATRIDMVACGKRCAGAVRAATFREKKRLDKRDARKRKKR